MFNFVLFVDFMALQLPRKISVLCGMISAPTIITNQKQKILNLTDLTT